MVVLECSRMQSANATGLIYASILVILPILVFIISRELWLDISLS